MNIYSGAKYWFERSIYSTERDLCSAFDMQRNRTYDCLLGMYSTYHFGVIEYNNDWSTLKHKDEDSLIEMLEVLACQTWVAFFSPINLFLSRSISLWDMRTQLRRHSWQIHLMEFHEHHFYFLHKWFAFFLAPLRTFLSNICSELFPHLDCSHAFCRTSTDDHSLLFTRKVVAWVASRPHSTFTEEPTCS